MKKLVPYFLGGADFARWSVALLDFEGVCLKQPAFAPVNFCNLHLCFIANAEESTLRNRSISKLLDQVIWFVLKIITTCLLLWVLQAVIHVIGCIQFKSLPKRLSARFASCSTQARSSLLPLPMSFGRPDRGLLRTGSKIENHRRSL